MMQKVKILPFSQEQLPAAAALAQRCFPDPWSLALFEAAFSQPDTTLFAAMANDTLAGYLILQRLGDEESVDDIAVAPEFGDRESLNSCWKRHTHNFQPVRFCWKSGNTTLLLSPSIKS